MTAARKRAEAMARAAIGPPFDDCRDATRESYIAIYEEHARVIDAYIEHELDARIDAYFARRRFVREVAGGTLERREQLLRDAGVSLKAMIDCHLDYCDRHSLHVHPTVRGGKAMDLAIDTAARIRDELGDAK